MATETKIIGCRIETLQSGTRPLSSASRYDTQTIAGAGLCPLWTGSGATFFQHHRRSSRKGAALVKKRLTIGWTARAHTPGVHTQKSLNPAPEPLR